MIWKRITSDPISFLLATLGFLLVAAFYVTVVALFANAAVDPMQNWW